MQEKQIIFCRDDVPIVVPEKIMVFAGHPDDELISCGGTILKYLELGSEVYVVVATTGLGGYAKEEHKETISSQRENELKKVVEQLNCKFIELGYSSLEVNRSKISKITNLIRDYMPQVILIPHFTDFHRIHRNLSIIAREAIYHCATGKAYGGHDRQWMPYGVYYYESPSCKFQYIEGSVFVVVDIEKYWEQKKRIFKEIYISQKEVLERVIDWAEDTAILRGNEINSKFGEAYIPETTYTPLKILLV
jgi:LmbE family N-acetylglucosaminyl deacetylase